MAVTPSAPGLAATYVIASYTVGDSYSTDLEPTATYTQLAQTFITDASAHNVNSVRLLLNFQDSAGNGYQGTISVSIRDTVVSGSYLLPTGLDLCSGSLVVNVNNYQGWYQINTTSSYPLAANTSYALVVSATLDNGNVSDDVRWRTDNNTEAPNYAGGNRANLGTDTSWQGVANSDFLFEVLEADQPTVTWDGGGGNNNWGTALN
jgi:hypothetical protein